MPRPLITSGTLALLLVAQAGCAGGMRRVAPTREPIAERASFVEQRAGELIRRGVPRDQAITKASGEWFNQSLAADTRADEERRFAQQQVHRQLSKLEREERTR